MSEKQDLPSPASVFGTDDLVRRAGQTLISRIVWFCLLISAGVIGLVAAVVWEQRSAAIERAQGDASNLSAAFEEQVRRVMNNVSGAMDLLSQRIGSEGADFDLYEWTKQVPELAASTVQVAIIGPDGWLAASTLDRHPEPVDLSDREHFIVHRDNPNAGLFIGKPVRGRVSNKVTIQVTRRLNRPDGSFGGVLTFSLDPEFLTGLHRKVDLGRSGSIVLIGKTDGVIRARFTSAENMSSSLIGKAVPTSRAVVDARTMDGGNWTGPSSLDGVTRIFSWHAVAGYPLVVAVGLGKEEALLPADRHARVMFAFGATVIGLTIIAMLLLRREIQLRVDREIAVHMESEKLRAANESLMAQHRQLLVTSAELAGERVKLQRANTELAIATAKAEEASRAKSSFLANMSHELRTPLNAIIGFSEIIRDRIFGDDAARYGECAADIHISGVHLLNIINGILDVAKIEAGKFELYEEIIPLGDIIAAAQSSVAPQAASGEVTIVVDMPQDGAALLCDETRFKQIVINLLSNAVKFTDKGGTVTLTAEHEADGGICLTVADTGIGMSREEMTSALELFRQVDNRLARRFEGTGLGLPLAMQLAKLHGADLHLDSTPGIGTVASMHIPAARVIRSKAAQEHADRRRARRDPVTHVVFLHSDRHRFRTRTVDLSETGVRIERVAGFIKGDRVRVDIGAQTLEGIVVWQNHSHIGVKFITPDNSLLPAGMPSLHHAA